MDLLKGMLIDFLLFSIIEAYIFTLFFNKVGGSRKFKWNEIVGLAILNCLCSTMIPPLFFHIIGITYMSIIVYRCSDLDIKKSILVSAYATAFMFVVEIGYCIFSEYVLDFVFYGVNNKFVTFLYLIPTKIIEMILILKGGDRMKWVIGTITRR